MVDCMVVAGKPEYHMQAFVEACNPGFSGEIRVPASMVTALAMSEREIIDQPAQFDCCDGGGPVRRLPRAGR
jgi:propionate CoA-transferase